MEIDTNNQSNKLGQGEVSQANTSESVSNSQPPPDLSHLIALLKAYKKFIIWKRDNYSVIREDNYYQGGLDIINIVLTSLGVED